MYADSRCVVGGDVQNCLSRRNVWNFAHLTLKLGLQAQNHFQEAWLHTLVPTNQSKALCHMTCYCQSKLGEKLTERRSTYRDCPVRKVPGNLKRSDPMEQLWTVWNTIDRLSQTIQEQDIFWKLISTFTTFDTSFDIWITIFNKLWFKSELTHLN